MENLVADAKEGNKEAKEKLIKRLEPLIYKMMLRVPKAYRDVDELYQESVLLILNLLINYDTSKGVTFPAYVKLNLRYYYLDRCKINRNDISLDDGKDDAIPLIEKIEDLKVDQQQSNYVERKEEISLINEALDTLTAKQRKAVTAYYLQNKSISEVAAALNCSYSTAVKHKTRGMDKIRKYFKNNA